ncbi:unnamed protein product, partial [Mesorhabditis spiculigera]
MASGPQSQRIQAARDIGCDPNLCDVLLSILCRGSFCPTARRLEKIKHLEKVWWRVSANSRPFSWNVTIVYYTKISDARRQPRWVSTSECAGVEPGSCIIHSNKSAAPEADALVFTPRYVVLQKSGKIRIEGVDIDPKTMRTRPEQLFVFAFMESPERFNSMHLPHDFFNATMTHLLDSDIEFSYRHRWVTREQAENEGIPFLPALDHTYLSGPPRNRTHFISGFISNMAAAPSGRSQILGHLAKLGKLSLFGGGGATKADKNKCGRFDEGCVRRVFEDSYFFLAMENSVCQDYVSEKYWDRADYASIPIMLSRNITNKQEMPEKAGIFLDDYHSLDAMVKYMDYLVAQPSEYAKYIDWKKDLMLIRRPNAANCALCRYVQSNPSPKTYEDVYDLYTETSNCQPKYGLKFLPGKS